MDKEKISASHFVGISLGTILIRQLGEMYPKRVTSMVMAGAIMKLNVRSQILMRFGNIFKSIVPYLWLYRFFAYIIMPKKSHKESRILFVREAKKLYQKEFLRWYKLTAELKHNLRLFRQVDIKIPTLYVMGSEDYMFLPSIEKLSQAHHSAQLMFDPYCGHVVNVDQPEKFNRNSISFIQKLAN
jgi:pimeloyl-ACP methyl ester carboxylesterase